MRIRLQWLLACFMVVTLVTAPAVCADGEWQQWKEEKGIIGYERSVEGSKYLETKAETEIDAPMEVLLEVLMDIPNFPKWMHDCKEATVLEKENDFHRVLYFNQNVPAIGQSDRWAVIDSKTSYEHPDGSCTTTLQSIDRPYQRADGKGLRMNKYTGTFELKMLSRGKTWVRYTAYSDPAGFAPAFVAKSTIRKVTFNGVDNWARMAKDPHCIKAAETGVAKPIIEKAIADGIHKLSQK